MDYITFTHNGETYELRPDRNGNYGVFRREDGCKACTVGFSKSRGFMKGSYNGAWEMEETLEVAVKAIKAYWSVHRREY